jgi:hypothetical protein
LLISLPEKYAKDLLNRLTESGITGAAIGRIKAKGTGLIGMV